MTPTTGTAQAVADAILRATDPRTLLRKYAHLTRQMQASETSRTAELDRTADLRAKRDLIEAELLRRIEGRP